MSVKDRKQQRQDFTGIATLEKLLGVSQSLIVVRDLDTLLQKIVESAGVVLRADVIVLYEYREEIDDVIVPPVTWGDIRHPEVLRETSRVRPHKESAVFKMLEREEPVYAPSAGGDWARLIEGWSQEGSFVHREGIVSSASVPLIVDEKRVGVLFVNYRTCHTFPDEERRIIELFATQAAIAIQNARLLANLQRQAKGHQTLNKVGTTLAGMLDEEAILQSVAHAVADTLDCTHCTVFRVEDAGIVIRAAEGNRGWSLPLGRTFSVGQGVAGWVAQMGISTLVAYTHKDERFDPGWSAPQPDPQSLVVVPIFLGGEVYGVISAEHDREAAFDEQDQRLLGTLALQASQAVRNARLLQQERTLRRQAETLREISGTISSEEELKEIAEKILDELGKVIEYRRASLQLVREDGESRILLAARGFDEKAFDRWFLRPISLDRLASRLVTSQKPLILSEPSKDPDWGIHPATADVKSWVGIPLVYGQETIGLLTLDHDQPGFYAQAIKDQLTSFANRVAIDIWNVHLFDSAQRRIRDLEIINEVVQVISTKLDYEDLLQTIVSRIADQLNCTHCTLFLPREERGELLLVPQVTHGLFSEQIKARRFKRGEGLAGWVFQHGKSVVLDNAIDDPRFAPATVEKDQPRSMLVAPVKVGDRTIGVISADQDEYGWFSESDRRLVDTLAQQAGIAIQRATGLVLLQDIGTRTISAPMVDDILQEIVSGAIKLTHTTSGVIYLISEDGTSVSKSFQYPPDIDHPAPRMDSEDSITRQVVATGEMLISPDIRQDARVNPALHDHVRSMIAIPLKLERKVMGVLYLNDADWHDFTETEISLLSTLASQAASAIRNARLIQHSHEVSRLALTGDYEKLADYVVEAVNDLTAASATLWMLDEKENVLRIQAGRGVRREYMESAITPIEFGRSITSLALRDRRPVSRRDILDETEEPRFYNIEEAVRQGWRSFLSVPLLGQAGQPLGTLSVYYTEPRDFSEPETALLWTFANQATIAFENVQTVRKLNTQLESLHRIVQEQSLQEVLERILEGVNAILGEASSSSINLYEEKTGRFEPSVAIGPLQDLVRVSPRPDGTGRFVLSTGEALYLDDVHYPPPGFPTIRAESIARGIKSFAALPLRRKERILGVLFVNLQKPISFSEGIQRVLELFASQAAVAIENARLFQELDDRAERLVQLQEVTAAISAEPSDLARLLHSIVDRLRDIFKGASCAIRLYDSRKDEFGSRVAVGTVERLIDHPPRSSKGTSQYVVQTRQPLYIEDVSATPPDGAPMLRREVLELGIKAAAYLPLLSKGEVIGILYMDLTKPRQFSQYDKQILRLFADQAAIAIENARLYEYISQDLERRIRQLEVLPRIYEKIIAVGIEDIDRILDLLYEEASEVLDLSNAQVQIAFYDEAKDEVSFPLAVEQDDGEIIDVVRWSERLVKYIRPLFGVELELQSELEQGIVSKALLRQLESHGNQLPDNISVTEREEGHLWLIEDTKLLYFVRKGEILEVYTSEGELLFCLELILLDALEAGLSSKALRQRFEDNKISLPDDISITTYEKGCLWTIEGGEQKYTLAKVEKLGIYKYEEVEVKEFQRRARRDPPGLNEHVIRTKQPLLIVEDFEQKAKDRGIQVWPTFGRLVRPTHSWLGVPMMVGGRVIGVISIQSLEQERAFDEEQQELLSTVSNQAAVAIENARLYSDLHQQLEEIRGLQLLSLEIASKLDTNDLLKAVTEQTNVVIGADFTTILLYDEARGEFHTGYRIGADMPQPSLPTAEGLAASIVRTGSEVIIENCEADPRLKKEFVRAKGLVSTGGFPIAYGGTSIGVLFVNFQRPHRFSERELYVLRMIASQAAVAIENARLYEKLKIELSTTEQQQEALRSLLSVNQIAGRFVHRISQLAGTVPIDIQFIQDKIDPESPIYEDLEEIRTQMQQMLGMVQRIRDSALKLEESQHLQEVEAGELMERALAEIRGGERIPSWGLKIAVIQDYRDQPLIIETFELLFVEALGNLMSNAIEAMSQGGTLTLCTERRVITDTEFAVLTVADTGGGIPTEDLKLIFGMGYSTKPHGFGYGLWLVKQICDATGTQVEVDSKEGVGSTFHLVVPLVR